MTTAALLEIILIAVGLAMDAFAVSLMSGSIVSKMRLRHAVRIAVFFGLFQGVMPLLGWLAGELFAAKIAAYDHWVAFILLAGIGGKMIYESFDEEKEPFDPLDVAVLFTLSIATSIDALAVGVTFSVLGVSVAVAAALIGVITCAISFVGVKIGATVGEKLGSKVELFGGLVLVGIGGKILIEHLLRQG